MTHRLRAPVGVNVSRKMSLSRAVALLLLYSLAPLLLGSALAGATIFYAYPGLGDLSRPLIVAMVLLILMLAGWFSISEHRPRPEVIAVQIAMWWSLITGASIIRAHLQETLRPWEITMLIICISSFAGGAWLTRRSNWGKKWFVRK